MNALASATLAAGAAAAVPGTGTYVTFDLAGQTFGVPVAWVREILDRIAVSALPNAPHGVEGIIDLRGRSIPIVDLSSRLALPGAGDGSDTRIIVFEIRMGGALVPVGVVADRVRNVTAISAAEIEAPPAYGGSRNGLLTGLARQDGALILLLDLARAFGAEDAAALDFGL